MLQCLQTTLREKRPFMAALMALERWDEWVEPGAECRIMARGCLTQLEQVGLPRQRWAQLPLTLLRIVALPTKATATIDVAKASIEVLIAGCLTCQPWEEALVEGLERLDIFLAHPIVLQMANHGGLAHLLTPRLRVMQMPSVCLAVGEGLLDSPSKLFELQHYSPELVEKAIAHDFETYALHMVTNGFPGAARAAIKAPEFSLTPEWEGALLGCRGVCLWMAGEAALDGGLPLEFALKLTVHCASNGAGMIERALEKGDIQMARQLAEVPGISYDGLDAYLLESGHPLTVLEGKEVHIFTSLAGTEASLMQASLTTEDIQLLAGLLTGASARVAYHGKQPELCLAVLAMASDDSRAAFVAELVAKNDVVFLRRVCRVISTELSDATLFQALRARGVCPLSVFADAGMRCSLRFFRVVFQKGSEEELDAAIRMVEHLEAEDMDRLIASEHSLCRIAMAKANFDVNCYVVASNLLMRGLPDFLQALLEWDKGRAAGGGHLATHLGRTANWQAMHVLAEKGVVEVAEVLAVAAHCQPPYQEGARLPLPLRMAEEGSDAYEILGRKGYTFVVSKK